MNVDHSPPVAGVAATAAAGTLATLALVVASPAGAGVAALGTLVALAGLLRPSRRAVGWGAVLAGAGVVVGGATGGTPLPLLLGAVGAVAVWDFGEHALGLGEQLTGDTDATRNVAVHALATLGVGVAVSTVGFGVYTGATGGQPVVAVFFLVAGAVGVAAALR